MSENNVIRGWKLIADAVGVSIKTARSYAEREEHPLKVEKDVDGFYLERGVLIEWQEERARRSRMSYPEHLKRLRAARHDQLSKAS